MLTKFILVSEKHFQNTETVFKNQQASIQGLKTQIGQLAKLISERPQDSLPSNTETNPREQLHAITVRDEEGVNRINLTSEPNGAIPFYGIKRFPIRYSRGQRAARERPTIVCETRPGHTSVWDVTRVCGRASTGVGEAKDIEHGRTTRSCKPHGLKTRACPKLCDE
ncbi:hypothetical protein GOBAR_AA06702 [Gossypium barbadense]|uniref:Uncharacterized protein n=1 Tax=Gossypium barbadense TaxID=3634 RepID=A0A2P5YE52_GOSBA|nr:hypothetical protein GOBAR_AA06702 [Gossypium barbadense]